MFLRGPTEFTSPIYQFALIARQRLVQTFGSMTHSGEVEAKVLKLGHWFRHSFTHIPKVHACIPEVFMAVSISNLDYARVPRKVLKHPSPKVVNLQTYIELRSLTCTKGR
ncbi:hypothetical protein KAH85_01685 [Candidatus Bathyarchaeota archaeon]|nr:hypothetical protein [Candidatus Bathyarchaeota archaeon]